MYEQREKLIELIMAKSCIGHQCGDNCLECNRIAITEPDAELIADRLLENGAIVPPCKVGDVVYFLLEDNYPVHKWYISEETVTEVCSKGIFTSGYYPPRDDLGEYSGYELFGKEIFLTKEEAESEQAGGVE